MNKLVILVPLSLIPLALVPLASAQLDTSSITDGLSNLGATLSGYLGQAQQFAVDNPIPTTIMGTGVAGTGVCAYGWNKVSSTVKGLKDKLTGAESQISSVTDQLSAYKTQAESQLASYQSDAAKQLEAYKSQATNATGQLSGIQSKLEEALQQKASLKNQFDELKATSDKTITGLQAQVALLSKKLDV